MAGRFALHEIRHLKATQLLLARYDYVRWRPLEYKNTAFICITVVERDTDIEEKKKKDDGVDCDDGDDGEDGDEDIIHQHVGVDMNREFIVNPKTGDFVKSTLPMFGLSTERMDSVVQRLSRTSLQFDWHLNSTPYLQSPMTSTYTAECVRMWDGCHDVMTMLWFVKTVTCGLVRAIRDLHQSNIIHLNIQPAYILLMSPKTTMSTTSCKPLCPATFKSHMVQLDTSQKSRIYSRHTRFDRRKIAPSNSRRWRPHSSPNKYTDWHAFIFTVQSIRDAARNLVRNLYTTNNVPFPATPVFDLSVSCEEETLDEDLLELLHAINCGTAALDIGKFNLYLRLICGGSVMATSTMKLHLCGGDLEEHCDDDLPSDGNTFNFGLRVPSIVSSSSEEEDELVEDGDDDVVIGNDGDDGDDSNNGDDGDSGDDLECTTTSDEDYDPDLLNDSGDCEASHSHSNSNSNLDAHFLDTAASPETSATHGSAFVDIVSSEDLSSTDSEREVSAAASTPTLSSLSSCSRSPESVGKGTLTFQKVGGRVARDCNNRKILTDLKMEKWAVDLERVQNTQSQRELVRMSVSSNQSKVDLLDVFKLDRSVTMGGGKYGERCVCGVSVRRKLQRKRKKMLADGLFVGFCARNTANKAKRRRFNRRYQTRIKARKYRRYKKRGGRMAMWQVGGEVMEVSGSKKKESLKRKTAEPPVPVVPDIMRTSNGLPILRTGIHVTPDGRKCQMRVVDKNGLELVEIVNPKSARWIVIDGNIARKYKLIDDKKKTVTKSATKEDEKKVKTTISKPSPKSKPSTKKTKTKTAKKVAPKPNSPVKKKAKTTKKIAPKPKPKSPLAKKKKKKVVPKSKPRPKKPLAKKKKITVQKTALKSKLKSKLSAKKKKPKVKKVVVKRPSTEKPKVLRLADIFLTQSR